MDLRWIKNLAPDEARAALAALDKQSPPDTVPGILEMRAMRGGPSASKILYRRHGIAYLRARQAIECTSRFHPSLSANRRQAERNCQTYDGEPYARRAHS
jgi:hypothetical protein